MKILLKITGGEWMEEQDLISLNIFMQVNLHTTAVARLKSLIKGSKAYRQIGNFIIYSRFESFRSIKMSNLVMTILEFCEK